MPEMNAPVDPPGGLPNPVPDPVLTELDVEQTFILRTEVDTLLRLFCTEAQRKRARFMKGPQLDSKQRTNELLKFVASASPAELGLLQLGLRVWAERHRVTVPQAKDLLRLAERQQARLQRE